MGNASEKASMIMGAFEAWAVDEMRRTSTAKPLPNVYASMFTPCARQMVLFMDHHFELPEFSAEVLYRMRRGSDRERDLLIDFQRAGRFSETPFEVVGAQERFELKDRKGRVVITGKVDASIQFERNVKRRIEVKFWNANLVERVKCFDDLFNSPWTKKGAYQLLCYMFAYNEPEGFMLLDRAGLPLLLPVELTGDNLGRVEEFLTLAETAKDHQEAGTLPDFCKDKSECRRCRFFGSHCNPPTVSGEGARVFDDPEMEIMLDRRAELEEFADEFDQIDKKLKSTMRGCELGLCGKFMIEGKWQISSKLVLPDDLKKQYTVKDPQGKFVLKFTKIS